MSFSRIQASATPGSIAAGTSLADTWDSTTGSGDGTALLAVITFNTNPSNPSITPPAGWTLWDRTDTATVLRAGIAIYHILNPVSPRSGTETFTLGSDADATLHLIEYEESGGLPVSLSTLTKVRDDSGASTGSTGTKANVHANAMGLVVFASRPLSAGQSGITGSFTQIGADETETRNNTEGIRAGLYDKVLSAPGGEAAGITFAGGVFWAATLGFLTAGDPVPISFLGAGAQAQTITDGGTIQPALTAHAAGDVSFCLVMTNGNNVPTISGGWTEIASYAQNHANQSTKLWYRVHTGSGETAPTVTDGGTTALSSSNGMYGRCYTWRSSVGFTTPPFEDATPVGNTTAETTPDTAAIDTTGDDRQVVNFCAIDDDSGFSSGHPPANWADEVADSTSTTGGDNRFCVLGRYVAAASSVGAAVVGTLSSSESWRSLTLALVPDAGGPTDHTGAASLTTTVNIVSAAKRTLKGASTSTFTLNIVSAARSTRKAASSSTFTVGIASAAVHFKVGAASLTVTAGITSAATQTSKGASASTYTLAVTSAARQTSKGASTLTIVVGVTSSARSTRMAAASSTFTFGAVSTAQRETFGASTSTYTLNVTSAAERFVAGASSLTVTFNAASAAERTATGAASTTITLSVASSARRTAYAAATATYTLSVASEAVQTSKGSASATTTFSVASAARQTSKGAASLPITLTINTAVRVTYFAASSSTYLLSITSTSEGNLLGSASLTITLDRTSSAQRETFGAASLPLVLGVTTLGQRTTFGAASLPIIFQGFIAADRTLKGAATLTVTLGITSAAAGGVTGSASLSLIFGSTASARHEAKGSATLPIVLTVTSSGEVEPGAVVENRPGKVRVTMRASRITAALGTASPRISVTTRSARIRATAAGRDRIIANIGSE